MPAEALAVHGLDRPSSSRTSRSSTRWSTTSSLSSATRRSSSTMPLSTSASSMPSLTASGGRRSRASGWSTRCCLARRKHPGVSNRLDDLCSRYAIDNSRRTKHGALLDAELLAEVYVDLIGARQSQLDAGDRRPGRSGVGRARRNAAPAAAACRSRQRITDADREAHRAFVATSRATSRSGTTILG